MTVVRNEFELGENSPSASCSSGPWRRRTSGTTTARRPSAPGRISRTCRSIASGVLQAAITSRTTPCCWSPASSTKARRSRSFTSTSRPIPRPARKLERIYTTEPTQDGERTVTLRRVGDTQLVAAVYHVPSGAHEDSRRSTSSPRSRRHAVRPAAQGAGRVQEGQQRVRLQLPVARTDDCDARRGGADRQLAGRGTRRAAGNDRRADRGTAHEGRGRARPCAAVEEHRAESQQLGHDRPDVERVHRRRRLAAVLPASRSAAQGHDRRGRQRARRSISSHRIAPWDCSSRRNSRIGPRFPATPDSPAVLKDYKGDAAVAAGEAFDPSPANIEKRTSRTPRRPGWPWRCSRRRRAAAPSSRSSCCGMATKRA